MRIGYGRNRKDKDFRKHGVEQLNIFIDTDASERMERQKCIQYARGWAESYPDDPVTLILYSWGEFGRGADLVRQKEKIEEMGILAQLVTDRGPKGQRGRPKGSADFNPTPQHDAEIKLAYHDEGRTPAGIIAIAKRAGYDVTMSQLKYRYGNRFK